MEKEKKSTERARAYTGGKASPEMKQGGRIAACIIIA
jgi:hypothetical protein